MTTVAVQCLTRCLDALDYPDQADPAEIREEIERALLSLRQGPRVLNDLDVYQRLNAEIKKRASIAQAARDWGVTRQTLFAVLNSDRPCPPSILSQIGLRRIEQGRQLYTLID